MSLLVRHTDSYNTHCAFVFKYLIYLDLHKNCMVMNNMTFVSYVVETFWAEISSDESRAFLREESDPRWGIDKTQKQLVPNESFRKLNID